MRLLFCLVVLAGVTAAATRPGAPLWRHLNQNTVTVLLSVEQSNVVQLTVPADVNGDLRPAPTDAGTWIPVPVGCGLYRAPDGGLVLVPPR